MKRNSARAAAFSEWLQSLEGVACVVTNPVTGSALIGYRTERTSGDRLISAMRCCGWLDAPGDSPPAGGSPAGFVLRCLAEVVVERSLSALLAAVF